MVEKRETVTQRANIHKTRMTLHKLNSVRDALNNLV